MIGQTENKPRYGHRLSEDIKGNYNSKTKVGGLLRNLDCFGEPISMQFNGKQHYNTTLGGCITLIIAVISLLIAISSIEPTSSSQVCTLNHVVQSVGTIDNMDSKSTTS